LFLPKNFLALRWPRCSSITIKLRIMKSCD
jgi:hypothetical protein